MEKKEINKEKYFKKILKKKKKRTSCLLHPDIMDWQILKLTELTGMDFEHLHTDLQSSLKLL